MLLGPNISLREGEDARAQQQVMTPVKEHHIFGILGTENQIEWDRGRPFYTIYQSRDFIVHEPWAVTFKNLVLFIYISVLPACISLHYVCTVPMDARRVSDPLDLELTVSS